MTEKQPLVSIGLPVYNGEKYLEQSIHSILSQTFGDFELIISDNGSTDRTSEICKEFAASDPRIRYYHNETNIGGGENHILTYKLSRGKYFRWAADDDICHPDLINNCLLVLESNPSIALCYTALIQIDENGNNLGTQIPNRGLSTNPYIRFRELADRQHKCEETYGLVRSETLNKTSLKLQYTNSDRVLFAELSLYGQFYQIQEPLFYKRYHSRNQYLDWRSRMKWYIPGITGRVVLPNWLEFRDYFAIIQRSPLSLDLKMQCYTYITGPWLIQNRKQLAKDLYIALCFLLHSKEWRNQYFIKTTNWI